jgi:hypothetical protein
VRSAFTRWLSALLCRREMGDALYVAPPPCNVDNNARNRPLFAPFWPGNTARVSRHVRVTIARTHHTTLHLSALLGGSQARLCEVRSTRTRCRANDELKAARLSKRRALLSLRCLMERVRRQRPCLSTMSHSRLPGHASQRCVPACARASDDDSCVALRIISSC